MACCEDPWAGAGAEAIPVEEMVALTIEGADIGRPVRAEAPVEPVYVTMVGEGCTIGSIVWTVDDAARVAVGSAEGAEAIVGTPPIVRTGSVVDTVGVVADRTAKVAPGAGNTAPGAAGEVDATEVELTDCVEGSAAVVQRAGRGTDSAGPTEFPT